MGENYHWQAPGESAQYTKISLEMDVSSGPLPSLAALFCRHCDAQLEHPAERELHEQSCMHAPPANTVEATLSPIRTFHAGNAWSRDLWSPPSPPTSDSVSVGPIPQAFEIIASPSTTAVETVGRDRTPTRVNKNRIEKTPKKPKIPKQQKEREVREASARVMQACEDLLQNYLDYNPDRTLSQGNANAAGHDIGKQELITGQFALAKYYLHAGLEHAVKIGRVREWQAEQRQIIEGQRASPHLTDGSWLEGGGPAAGPHDRVCLWGQHILECRTREHLDHHLCRKRRHEINFQLNMSKYHNYLAIRRYRF